MNRILPTLALGLLLCACSPERQAPSAAPSVATPTARSTGAALPAAALTALRQALGPDAGALRYFGRSIDLNGDGRDEAVVHLNGLFVCGSGGCDTWVLHSDAAGQWTALRALPTTRAPIAALASRTNGWRDLAVTVGGGGGASGAVRATFDGQRYVKGEPVTAIATDGAGSEILVPAYQSGDEGAPLP